MTVLQACRFQILCKPVFRCHLRGDFPESGRSRFAEPSYPAIGAGVFRFGAVKTASPPRQCPIGEFPALRMVRRTRHDGCLRSCCGGVREKSLHADGVDCGRFCAGARRMYGPYGGIESVPAETLHKYPVYLFQLVPWLCDRRLRQGRGSS